METWITVIQNATSRMLDCQVPSAMTDSTGGGNSRSLALRELPGNNVCSDCGSENPEWASVSLGVLFCVNCSGIHRAMGVHVSRVRSLTLDVWEDSLLQMMTELGNDKVNAIMMSKYADTPDLLPAISPEAKREEREAHIRSKYEQKSWIQSNRQLEISQLGPLLESALESKDLAAVLDAVVMGADVNEPLDKEENVTPLMQAVHEDFVPALELLYHSGADIGVKDSLGRTALHHAAMMDARESTQVLLQRGARSDVRDHYGKTALEVAAIAPGAVAFEVIVRSKGLKVGQEDDQGGSPGSNSPSNMSRGASPVHQPMSHDGPPPMPSDPGGATYTGSSNSADSVSKSTPHHRRGLSWSGMGTFSGKGIVKESSVEGPSQLTHSATSSAADLTGFAGAATLSQDSNRKSGKFNRLGKLMKGLSHLKPSGKTPAEKDKE
eukprot:CAMPEP_0184294368 /NCGR_PEP_ID=MMETSP1049-20130417/5576_1 /TAXON_ID=77928 /ORGANISM="Proteomonas sulcata, Strain CCMP704" /LENGTH=437 /DNA_ID=CAMNT_0026602621 /DNA_START=60 /DNA_END=1373 /DNA_ORIENTATION=-